MKTQYIALIKDTILKEARSKTLILLFVVTTIVILLGHAGVSMMSANMEGGQDVALFGGSVLTIILRILNTLIFLIAVIFGVSTIRSDFQNNIIYQYLTFPISRTEYFFIRILGTWLLVLGYYVYAYIFSFLLYTVSFKTMIFGVHHLLSFLVMAVYILIVLMLSIFFSMMFNKLGAFVSIFILSMVSSMAFRQYNGLAVNEYLVDFNIFKGLGLFIYMLFPRMEFLSELSSQVLDTSRDVFIPQMGMNIAHLIILSAVYVFIANTIVKKKNF